MSCNLGWMGYPEQGITGEALGLTAVLVYNPAIGWYLPAAAPENVSTHTVAALLAR
jgi:hypothetical protein